MVLSEESRTTVYKWRFISFQKADQVCFCTS